MLSPIYKFETLGLVTGLVTGLALPGCGPTSTGQLARDTARRPVRATPRRPPPSRAVAVAPEVQRAIALADRGDLQGAEKVLRKHLIIKPDDWRARVVLSKVLVLMAKNEDAVKVLRAGLRNKAFDYPLWMEIGEIRMQRGDDGLGIKRTGTWVSASPNIDPAADKRYKKRQLQLALGAYRAALSIRKNSAQAAAGMAKAFTGLGKHLKAAKVWGVLVNRTRGNAQLRMLLAASLQAAGKTHAAARVYEHALAINPHLPKAHQSLAAYYAAKGQTAKAALSKKKAAFYAWLPAFINLRFAAKHQQTIADLSSKNAAVRQAVFTRLAADTSRAATAMLTAICWRHIAHGKLEKMAFGALEKRKATAVLLQLVENARSVCTIRQALHSLARLKAPGVFKILTRLLPRDVRPVHPMFIADCLAILGDKRAVPHLIKVIGYKIPKPVKGSHSLFGRYGHITAKVRALLALSHFKTPKVITALTAATNQAGLKLYALVGLYALTGKAGHLRRATALVKANPKGIYHDYRIRKRLKGMKGDAVKGLIKVFKELEARRKKSSDDS